MTSAAIGVAVVGCGLIGGKRAAALGPHTGGGARLVACADVDLARAQALARPASAVATARWQEVVERADVGLVVVATRHDSLAEVTTAAARAGKHVLVEKPAFPTMADYETVREARDRAGRVVLVGENDHYKPLCVTLRRLLANDEIGEMVFAQFSTVALRLKSADDWRNDESMAGGDAFFEEGIHWLHIAGCLGPRIVAARGYRPSVSREGPDRRAKSMMVALEYDNQAVGALYYSREIPSLFKGLRVSKLFGRRGVITFESNGVFVIARGGAVPRLHVPGFRDIRGYQAMYRDFAAAIRSGRAPEMSLERAIEDQVLMDQIYASAASGAAAPR
jgi:predicted dehydrogenase